MFSTTKVMTLLLTSLLIFLAIELTVMQRKDPTEFRRRFLAYKEGKMPYENGLPKYEDGTSPNIVPFDMSKKIKLTNAGLATGAVLSENLLDSIADAAYRQGLPIRTAIGLATKESTLGNPTDDTSVYKILSPEKAEMFKQLGTGAHINNRGDMLYMKDVVNYHRPDKYPTNWNTFDRSFRFYSDYPEKYNPGQKNYTTLVDKRGDEVMNSPQVKKWYREWEDKLVLVKRPEPYKITTNIQNTAAPKFGSYKNGKLPGFEGGKPKGDGMKYSWNDIGLNWDRYTGDTMGDVFADFVVTPRGGAHKKDIQPLRIVTPEQELYVEKTQPTISTNPTWHYTPTPQTFAGRVALAFGGDWKTADITSSGLSIRPELSIPLGVMDFGYNLNQSVHNLTDADAHINTALSAAAILPFVGGGLKLLKGKDVGTKMLNAYNNYMHSLGNVDDINNILKNVRYLDATTDAAPAVDNMFKDIAKDPYVVNNMKRFLAQKTLSEPASRAGDDFFTGINIPTLYSGIVDKQTPEELKLIYYNTVLPRLEFMRPGYHGGLLRPTVKSHVDQTLNRGYTVYPKKVFDDAGEDFAVGLQYPSNGHIAVMEGYEDFAMGHEFRHRLDRTLRHTDDEIDILLDAYDPDFFELNKTVDRLKDVHDMKPEAITTNYDARAKLLGKYHLKNTPVNLQNKIIDAASDEKIFKALEESNGYGRAYVEHLRKIGGLTKDFANKQRKAMKYLGAFSIPTLMGYSVYNAQKIK